MGLGLSSRKRGWAGGWLRAQDSRPQRLLYLISCWVWVCFRGAVSGAVSACKRGIGWVRVIFKEKGRWREGGGGGGGSRVIFNEKLGLSSREKGGWGGLGIF